MAKTQKPTDIDGYISQFPAAVQAVLRGVREAIRRAAPEAEETISYQMPAFRQRRFIPRKQGVHNLANSISECVLYALETRVGRNGLSHGSLNALLVGNQGETFLVCARQHVLH